MTTRESLHPEDRHAENVVKLGDREVKVDYHTEYVPAVVLDRVLSERGKEGWHLVSVSATDKTSQAWDATRGDRLYLLVFKR